MGLKPGMLCIFYPLAEANGKEMQLHMTLHNLSMLRKNEILIQKNFRKNLSIENFFIIRWLQPTDNKKNCKWL